MGFAILRTQKLKSPAAVRRSLMHAFREQDTPNADIERTPDNSHLGASSTAEALERFNARLPDKVRSNAVLAVEYLVTGSPEAMNAKGREAQNAYFNDALQWLRDRHGAENVICAGIHRDETTPHMYAYVVPIDARGKLNCRAFLGGAAALSEMQTDFAERVGRKHDLERGIQGSKAKHQSIQQWYGQLSRPPAEPSISPEAVRPRVLEKTWLSRVEETPEMMAERLTKEIREAYAPIVAKASVSASEARRAKEMALTARHHENAHKAVQERLKAFTEPVRGLKRDQVIEATRALFEKAAQLQEQNKREKAQERARSGPER
jgi:hypothetical protein